MNIIQVPAHPNNYSKARTEKTKFVMHWIVGELSSADNTFKNPNRKASAHFGIGSGGEVHQYVDTQFVAWHAGDYKMNTQSIGIEHAGGQLINGKRKKPTLACHDASVELLTKLCKSRGIKKLVLGKNIFRHSDIKPTQCCGSLNVGYIIRNVNQNLQEPPKVEEPVELEWERKLMYAVTHQTPLVNIKTGEVIKSYDKNQGFDIAKLVEWKGEQYYITAYSALNNIWNGFRVSDLIKEPTRPEIPEQPEEGDKVIEVNCEIKLKEKDKQIDKLEESLDEAELQYANAVDFLNANSVQINDLQEQVEVLTTQNAELAVKQNNSKTNWHKIWIGLNRHGISDATVLALGGMLTDFLANGEFTQAAFSGLALGALDVIVRAFYNNKKLELKNAQKNS